MISIKHGWTWGLIFISVLALVPGISRGEEARYTNSTYGISFPIQEDMILYTPEHPGPFTFGEGNICIVINKWKPNELIMLNRSAVADEVDLDYLKSQMEEQGLQKPGYHKISVGYTSIGEHQRKRAVEHIFDLQGQAPRTMRYVCFVQRGQGLTFVCTSNTDRFQEINKGFFEPFFRSIKFE
jgi:hypothetical protein